MTPRTRWLPHLFCCSIAAAGCGGKQNQGNQGDALRPDYCTEFPGESYCRGEGRFGALQALESVDESGTLPAGARLVAVRSSSGAGLTPDGLLAVPAEWRLMYVVDSRDVYAYAVRVSGVSLEHDTLATDCAAEESISVDTLALDVQKATLQLETTFGVTYIPGSFALYAQREAACYWPGRRQHTLIHSQSQLPRLLDQTVEFDLNHPEGVSCDYSATGCVE